MTEEKIEILLRSGNYLDILLGVEYAVVHLGRSWCKKNFKDIREMRFSYKVKANTILDYEDFLIYLGSDYIEYWDKENFRKDPRERNTLTTKKIIKNEYNKLSKSTS